MNKFVWNGVMSGVSLNTPAGPVERLLYPGREVELPADNPWVATQVNKKRLVPVEPESAAPAEEEASAPAPAPEPAATAKRKKREE